MKSIRSLLLGAGLMAAVFGTTATAWAETTVHEKGRVVYHIAKLEYMDAGDVAGHIIAIADQRGLTTLASGEVGLWHTKVTLDLTQGSGPHVSYNVTTYADRSTTIIRGEGVTTAHADGTSTFEGTYVYTGGTGRFAGIKGSGRYWGKRLAPLAAGVPADLYQDFEATYTLP